MIAAALDGLSAEVASGFRSVTIMADLWHSGIAARKSRDYGSGIWWLAIGVLACLRSLLAKRFLTFYQRMAASR